MSIVFKSIHFVCHKIISIYIVLPIQYNSCIIFNFFNWLLLHKQSPVWMCQPLQKTVTWIHSSGHKSLFHSVSLSPSPTHPPPHHVTCKTLLTPFTQCPVLCTQAYHNDLSCPLLPSGASCHSFTLQDLGPNGTELISPFPEESTPFILPRLLLQAPIWIKVLVAWVMSDSLWPPGL